VSSLDPAARLADLRRDIAWFGQYRGDASVTSLFCSADSRLRSQVICIFPARLVSVAKLVDFERGQVSCADFIGITVLPRG
jgi:hypothetical protein